MLSTTSDILHPPMHAGQDALASDPALSRYTYAIILTGALCWCAALALAPILSAAGWSGAADLLYQFFHRICHQLEGRSLHLVGEPMAVCARCSAIYAGFLVGTAIYPLFRNVATTTLPPRMLLAGAVAPILLDVLGGLLGVHEITTVTRVVSGLIAGTLLPLFILPAAVGAVQQIAVARNPITISSTSEGLSDARKTE